MGLFDQVLSAIGDPSQQGNANQLGNILNTVQQLSGNSGADSSTMQTVLSLVGGQVRSALQEQRATNGDEYAQGLVNQFGGTAPNPQAVSSLFSPAMQQQVAGAVSQRTGLDANMVMQMLPMVVPVVLNFLKTGSNSQNPQSGGNPVLSAFLDADGDGDVDIADAMSMAGRYLQ